MTDSPDHFIPKGKDTYTSCHHAHHSIPAAIFFRCAILAVRGLYYHVAVNRIVFFKLCMTSQ